MLALALGLLLTAAPSAPSVRQLVDDAQKAYGKGNYPEAARLLELASKQDPSGRLLFNLARALEKAGEVEKAIVIYEAYLDRPDAELQAMKRARQALAGLYRKRPAAPEPPKKDEPPPAPVETKAPPVEPKIAAEPSPPQELVPPPPAKLVEPSPVAAPPTSARPLRTVGIVGLVAGGVVAGVGLGLGLWAQSTATSARSSVDPVQKPLLVGAALERATLTDVSFISAAGLAVAGAVFLLIDLLSQ